jgi:hypothetical protein
MSVQMGLHSLVLVSTRVNVGFSSKYMAHADAIARSVSYNYELF